jgi:hypothetical protein
MAQFRTNSTKDIGVFLRLPFGCRIVVSTRGLFFYRRHDGWNGTKSQFFNHGGLTEVCNEETNQTPITKRITP